jgi:two-component system, NarL family, response regulator
MHIQKNDPIRILIVDDHPVVCAGLASMLAGHEEFEVVGSVASGERALAVIRELGPAVILLDLRMPGMDGIAVLHALKSMASPPHALILTSFEKDEDIYRAIRAGAAGYLLKDTTEAEMVAAITQVYGGKHYMPRHIAARLAARRMRSDLTGREQQILELVAHGLTNKEIGRALNISENTVRHHVVSIMEKLEVSDRTDAVATAIHQGILPDGG